MAKQLNLFQTPMEDLEKELAALSEQINNVRRGLFKRYREMEKEMTSIKWELHFLKEKENNESKVNRPEIETGIYPHLRLVGPKKAESVRAYGQENLRSFYGQ